MEKERRSDSALLFFTPLYLKRKRNISINASICNKKLRVPWLCSFFFLSPLPKCQFERLGENSQREPETKPGSFTDMRAGVDSTIKGNTHTHTCTHAHTHTLKGGIICPKMKMDTDLTGAAASSRKAVAVFPKNKQIRSDSRCCTYTTCGFLEKVPA